MAEMWFPAPPETAHDGYNVMVCRCDGGAYIGARKAGTPCCCEVCGFMTQEQLDHLAQAARVEDVARLALCSQCGERPSVMVKIGTTDGWCTSCLDEAAETSQAQQIGMCRALLVAYGDDVPGGPAEFLVNQLTAALGVTAPTASEAGACCLCGHSHAQHQRGCTANVGSIQWPKTCACDRFESNRTVPAEASEVEGSDRG